MPTLTLILNGQPLQRPTGETIASLLAFRRLDPMKVAVELNKRLVRSSKYDTPLNDGDAIEIVTFVGGG
jgi:thiamine biosynthesis protein ThiS